MTRHRTYLWLWIVPILLLMTLLTMPRLDWDGIWYDELFSVMNSGGAHYGPYSPTELWVRVTQEDPYQALGYPYLLAGWGALVGWTELAGRYLSLLLAAVALAITYRLGRDAISPQVGVVAALVLGVSAFYIHYAHELRAFTMVALGIATMMWSYWRLLTVQKRPAMLAQVGFVAGALMALYAHYFAAMLLIGVGAYHLFFVPKNRRWWQLVLLAIIVSLLFIPQLQAFFEGFDRYDPGDVAEPPLSASGVVAVLAHYMSNGLNILLLIPTLGGILYAFKQRWVRMIVIVSTSSLIVSLLANEILDILEPRRLRYMILLWPTWSLWIGAGLVYLVDWGAAQIEGDPTAKPKQAPARSARAAALLGIICLVWVGNAVRVYALPTFTDTIAGDPIPRLRGIVNTLEAEGAAQDLLAFDNGTGGQAWYLRLIYDYATAALRTPALITSIIFDPFNEANRATGYEQVRAAQRIWFGVNRLLEPTSNLDDFKALLDAEGFVYCAAYIDRPDVSLDLYARSAVFCPSDAEIAQFGDEAFTLKGYEVQVDGDTLDVSLGWQVRFGTPPSTYSLAIHLQPAGEDGIVAQADTGLPVDPFVPMSATLDISELDAGEYDVWLTVYDWRTGERLLAQHQTASTPSPRVRIGSFQLSGDA